MMRSVLYSSEEHEEGETRLKLSWHLQDKSATHAI